MLHTVEVNSFLDTVKQHCILNPDKKLHHIDIMHPSLIRRQIQSPNQQRGRQRLRKGSKRTSAFQIRSHQLRGQRFFCFASSPRLIRPVLLCAKGGGEIIIKTPGWKKTTSPHTLCFPMKTRSHQCLALILQP